MLFNSIEFLLFLPLVFLLYWFLCRDRIQQNLLVVVASYVFYGWWDCRFLILITFTSLCSYWAGIAIGCFSGSRKKQKCISEANIVLNLLILGVFKYYNFFAESFAEFFQRLGYQMDVVTLNVILPVGISFYTFQALSYSIDVYQNKIKPTKDIVQFFAYISFFPQLVAGPIERATNLLPQFEKQRQFDYSISVDGLRQMLWGFFKKVVVADVCASYVNQYWDLYEELPGLMLIQIAVLFAFQIYCDFSGYSDIAIGCAKLFGIRLMRNFDNPYFSRNIGEFWRRWHISLMTWLRDYVYIPLGGSRCTKHRMTINTIIVFLISGLWHGANWTFVVWGGYNAILLIIGNVIGRNAKYKDIVAGNRLFPSMTEIMQVCFTFALVVIGWIIFRSENLMQVCGYFHSFATNGFMGDGFRILVVPVVAIILLIVIEWLNRRKDHVFSLPMRGIFRCRSVRYAAYYLIALSLYRFWGYSQEFIYFQF